MTKRMYTLTSFINGINGQFTISLLVFSFALFIVSLSRFFLTSKKNKRKLNKLNV